MGRHYKYQPRVREREQNNHQRDVGTREMTIKKIEVVGNDEYPEEIKLVFDGGTKHTMRCDDEEYRYNSDRFLTLCQVLAVGDKAKIWYDKPTSRIIRCDIELTIQGKTPQIESKGSHRIIRLFKPNSDEEERVEYVLDDTIKYIYHRRELITLAQVKKVGYIVTEAIFISERLAGIILW